MASDSEDDYMKFAVEDPAPPAKTETSLQRRQREVREGRARAHQKSKAELATEEALTREAALQRSLLDGAAARQSKGLAMMARMGFAGGPLGRPDRAGPRPATEPLRPDVRAGRGGVGLEGERKRKREHERGPDALAGSEGAREHLRRVEGLRRELEGSLDDYRGRLGREHEMRHLERELWAAQAQAHVFDEEDDERARQRRLGDDDDDDAAAAAAAARGAGSGGRLAVARPVGARNVLWREVARAKLLKERGRGREVDPLERGREEALKPLAEESRDHVDSDDEGHFSRKDDKWTKAKEIRDAIQWPEDLDDEEEDVQVAEFNELPVQDRLQRVCDYLRETWGYCFWCRDKNLEECPGRTEDDHDV